MARDGRPTARQTVDNAMLSAWHRQCGAARLRYAARCYAAALIRSIGEGAAKHQLNKHEARLYEAAREFSDAEKEDKS